MADPNVGDATGAAENDAAVDVTVFIGADTIARQISPGLATTTAANTPKFRAVPLGYELRDAAEGSDSLATLVGFLPTGEWTEIRSAREGHFMERIAPSAFTKTIQENGDRMRALFQHGRDPAVGEKPLGPITNLETRDDGVHYEVDLLDTAYNRDLLPGLRNGLYGSSFRFEPIREDVNTKAKRSDYNPTGLPERTVTELRMSEFGPVTFPAYAGSKSGVRSLTDIFTGSAPVEEAPAAQEANGESDNAPVETTAPAAATRSKTRRARPYSLNGKETPSWRLR